MRYFFSIYISYSQDSNLGPFDRDAYLSFDLAQRVNSVFHQTEPRESNLPKLPRRA